MAATKNKGKRAARASAGNRFARYEELKARWDAEHPGASFSEHEQAMRLIAKRCGV